MDVGTEEFQDKFQEVRIKVERLIERLQEGIPLSPREKEDGEEFLVSVLEYCEDKGIIEDYDSVLLAETIHSKEE